MNNKNEVVKQGTMQESTAGLVGTLITSIAMMGASVRIEVIDFSDVENMDVFVVNKSTGEVVNKIVIAKNKSNREFNVQLGDDFILVDASSCMNVDIGDEVEIPAEIRDGNELKISDDIIILPSGCKIRKSAILKEKKREIEQESSSAEGVN